MKSLVLVLVFLACFVAPASADYDVGLEAYDRGDYETALREFRPPAEKGDASSQFYLGLMYGYGQGVTQDFKEAVRWYRLAAEQGNAYGQFGLAFMYTNGRGVTQDFKEAARWWRLAAEQGNAPAQFNLGLMYSTGKGVPQDFVQAHMWLNIAAAQGIKNSSDASDLLASKMSRSQIEEAQRLAREWKPKK